MDFTDTKLPWIIFGAVIVLLLAVDLGLVHRKAHRVSTREALTWLSIWVGLALAFNAGVWWKYGDQRGLQFLTGYIIEQALSVDNIFVFIIIFSYFKVPAALQHRVLFWGIVGAAVLRAIFIFAGAALIERFHWMIWVFGGFLIYTGAKILLSKSDDDEVDPEKSIIVRLFRKLVPMSKSYEGQAFLVRQNGRLVATPLFLVLAVVEGTDVIFALDSIPAIFAVTTDPFIVYTSNIFAILGLRNLYFVLADFMDRFKYLKVGLGLVLVFVGTKMAISDYYKVPIAVSLGVVALLLVGSVVFSLLKSRHESGASELPKPND